MSAIKEGCCRILSRGGDVRDTRVKTPSRDKRPRYTRSEGGEKDGPRGIKKEREEHLGDRGLYRVSKIGVTG